MKKRRKVCKELSKFGSRVLSKFTFSRAASRGGFAHPTINIFLLFKDLKPDKQSGNLRIGAILSQWKWL
jgi:hypothetical protein